MGKALDYRDTFIPGTIINGHEVTAMTVSEVEEVLGDYQLKVSFRDEQSRSQLPERTSIITMSQTAMWRRFCRSRGPMRGCLALYKNTRYEIP